MKHADSLLIFLSLMIVPAFAEGRSTPRPPEVGTEPTEQSRTQRKSADREHPSNVGAVNEGGGSTNTTGMNNGLSPNSSGSGTNSSRAEDTMGIPLGGAPHGHTSTDTSTGTVAPTPPDAH